MLLKLGLTSGSTPEPRPQPEEPLAPAEPAVSLDEAIRQLEQLEPEAAEAVLPAAAAVDGVVPQDVSGAIAYWVARYIANPTAVARNIRELAAKEPDKVVESLLRLFDEGRWGDAAPFLARLMSGLGATAEKLCDPDGSLEAAVGVVNVLMRYEPRFDALFARILLDDDRLTDAARQRGLQVLEKLDCGGRLIPILMQFLRHPDSRICSKAALMFGQIMPTQRIMDRLMRDPDERVRANFVEGLWKRTSSDCRPLFRQALEDSNHRVVGNALVGLHRLGESREVIKHLIRMARHPEPLFRATAAWVMGQTGDERYKDVLRVMARDPVVLVRRNALCSQQQIGLAHAQRENGQPEATEKGSAA